MAQPKKDQDKEAEQAVEAPEVNAPRAMPATKFEGHRDPHKVAMDARIRGAYFLGGVWFAADGSPLTAVETQQAHRAADKAAAEARRKALLGGGE